MIKPIALISVLAAVAFASAQSDVHDQDKKDTVTHAVNHAGHWISNHTNAPHKTKYKKKYNYHQDTVSHAANHAGNWISHHVNAPHKNK